jgi:hypothetical protein
MTIAELIDYLNQFDGAARVYLHEADAPADSAAPYIGLDILLYADDADDAGAA